MERCRRNLLSKVSGVSIGKIRALASDGVLQQVTIDADSGYDGRQIFRSHPPALRPEQKAAAEMFGELLGSGRGRLGLLKGVPGSGKTEVYFPPYRASPFLRGADPRDAARGCARCAMA